MFKEQLIILAAKALDRASETKKILQTVVLQDESVKAYLKTLQKGAKWFAEQNFDVVNEEVIDKKPKKAKKSSVRPIKEISSEKADIIAKFVSEKNIKLVNDKKFINNKKTLTYILWSLNTAKKANIDGLSVHDISALLFKVYNINLYPINISLVINKNKDFILLIDNNESDKLYTLSKDGKKLFSDY